MRSSCAGDSVATQTNISGDQTTPGSPNPFAWSAANRRDITRNPPVGWSVARRREYFDWTRRVVDRIRGINAALEAHYDETLAHAYEALAALAALES